VEALKQAVWRYADAHRNKDGLANTPIPGVRMMCAYHQPGPIRSLYKPLLCLVLQGAKHVTAGCEEGTFAEGQSLVVGVDLPVIGRILWASPAQPYLALSIELDMAIMRDVMTQLPMPSDTADGRRSHLFTDETDEATRDCARRLMQLLDRPEAIPVLRPAILREMHYWLLVGRHGPAIRRIALPDGYAQRVAQAVAILRAEFDRPVAVGRLAAAAGMSLSSFHQHFRAVTSLSPIQFQKQLRLTEARRLMVGEGFNASRAAFAVGYESVPQFTREYARLFGAPPRRDIVDRRDAA
jgi:AraC-like DNA-binding protein